MTRAYSELYLNDAKENLAGFFDYGIRVCGFGADFFAELFVCSGYADRFERGNPAVVSGMSGVELATRVVEYAYRDYDFPKEAFSRERSDAYWAGWALAEYQWVSGRRFADIFSRISLSEIIGMYSVYHEMDIKRFVEEMDRRYDAAKQETHLKTIRENRGLSQNELARLSGVKLRSIQMYEQRVNNINKAQAVTLYKLSRILGCNVEDLLESPEL